MPDIDPWIRSAIRGEAVLVVGAGVSFLCDNGKGPVPSSENLIELLFEGLGEPLDLRAPLDQISEHYGQRNGYPELYSLIANNMKVCGVDNRYQKFLDLNWKRIYTTNFDNGIEFCSKNRRSHTPGSNLSDITRGDVVHLNGFVDDIDPLNFDKTTSLTSWSYASNRLVGSDLAHYFRSDIRAARHTIFLGISLRSDLDISRIIVESRVPENRILFVVGPETPPYEIATLERFGQVCIKGAEHAFDKLEQLRQTTSANSQEICPTSFWKFDQSEYRKPQNAYLLRDQLLFGKLDLNHLICAPTDDLVGANQRLISRQISSQIIEDLKAGRTNHAIIHGDIGSGKTFCAIEVCREMQRHGKAIYWAKGNRYDPSELHNICQDESDKIIVFDGLIEHREAIETAVKIRSASCTIILCMRTVVYELSQETVDLLFGDHRSNYVCRQLNDEELLNFDSILLASGLLGSFATGIQQGRIFRYKNSLGSSLFRILVDLIRSPHIREMIESELNPILSNDEVGAAFAAILIGSTLETDMDIDQWDECLGYQAVANLQSVHNRTTKHFVDDDGYAFISRPAVVGTELVREFFPARMIADGLMKLYSYAIKNSFQYNSQRIIETVMRYSRIERLFPDENKFGSLISYYNRLQDLHQTDSNSQYWLQKAIAASIHGDLTNSKVLMEANNYFSTAWARAGNSHRQKINIDNYYARFLLMHALNQESANDAIRLTSDGLTRLMRQIHSEEAKHYPFKAGRSLADVVIKFHSVWSLEQRAKMYGMLKRMISAAQRWKSVNSGNRDVDNMIKDCSDVISLVNSEA